MIQGAFALIRTTPACQSRGERPVCLPAAFPDVTIQLEIYNDDARLVVKVGPDMAGHGLISVLDMDSTTRTQTRGRAHR